ncbi:hypothetical protein Q4567_00205 [Aliiglaciecola sp. 2_MG-2023]|uniref:hypothetical protein n=1 Tax=unclassified Aliiglaciecola TaxID=2593648 RepID=UPI0026E30E3D|nr:MULTISPECIES: hypothetical protein [unclassified Aliiglaciecola]MDO6709129.1 hypothetical protein [Aliiglaciecola sp. 2_MG-2023]MDO6750277.1 hypothetical protein [Aliiglaciecola sp. 1_MG-2023]
MSSGILNKVAKKLKNLPYKFSIDKSDSEALAGWVIDNKHPSRLLFVDVKSNDKLIYRIEASGFRQDLLDANIGSGCHGFHIETSELLPNGGSKSFDIFVDGVKLNDDSIVLSSNTDFYESTKQSESIPVTAQASPTLADNYNVVVDVFQPGEVLGWIQPLDESSPAPVVVLKLNGVTLSEVKSDQYRHDLAEAGIKDGRVAYNIQYDVALLPTQDVQLELFVNNLKVDSSIHDFKLSANEIQAANNQVSQEQFVIQAGKEIDAISQQIRAKNIEQGLPAESYAGICNVLIEKLAEANVKIARLEALLKK